MTTPVGRGRVGVVGAGVCGLAAADALVAAGHRVALYEGARPGSGQSAGQTRIFRHAHADERLIDLAVEARAGWSAWERRFGVELLGREGVLAIGGYGGRRVAERGVPVEERSEGWLDLAGGAIRVQAVLGALAAQAPLVPAEVLALRERGGGVELHTTEGLRHHDRVLLCAGVGTAALAAQAGLEIPLAESLHLRATFAVRDPGAPLPCRLDRAEGVYGSHFPDHRHYGIGLSAQEGEGEGPAQRLADQLARVEAHVACARPDLVPGATGQRLCRVTALPWGGDAFAAFRVGSVVALAGTNLFKFAPVLGPMLAREALGEPVELLMPPATPLPRS